MTAPPTPTHAGHLQPDPHMCALSCTRADLPAALHDRFTPAQLADLRTVFRSAAAIAAGRAPACARMLSDPDSAFTMLGEAVEAAAAAGSGQYTTTGPLL